MATNNIVRLEFSQFGDFDSFDVFRSNEPMLLESLPAPVAQGLKTMFFVDSNVPDGDNYYRVRVNRSPESLVSEEMYIRVTNEWSIDPTLVSLWLKTSSLNGVQVGSKVATWLDESPNAYLYEQQDSTKQPTLESTHGGKKAVRFDGIDDILTCLEARRLGDGLQGITVFIAYAKPNTLVESRNQHLFLLPREGGGGMRFTLAATLGDSNKPYFLVRPLASSAALVYSVYDNVNKDFNVMRGYWGNGVVGFGVGTNTLEADAQGISPTTLQNPSYYSTDLAELCGTTSSGEYSSAGIMEIVVFRESLPLITSLKVEGDIAHRNGINEYLPDNHPYKWVKPSVAEDNKPYGVFADVTPDGITVKFGVSGLFDSVNYYVNTTPFTITTLPVAYLTGLTATSVVDTSSKGGHLVYVCVEAIKDGVSKFSDIVEILTAKPRALSLNHFEGVAGGGVPADTIAGVTWVSSTGILKTGGKFGNTCLSFSSTSNNSRYVTLANPLGSGDFTLEMWFKTTSTSDVIQYFLSSSSASQGWFAVGVNPITGVVTCFLNSGNMVTSQSVNTSTWTHVAFMRKEGYTYIFVNGVRIGKSATVNSRSFESRVYVGATATDISATYLQGDIDEFRASKEAVYPVDGFTPPNAPF